MKYTIVNQFVKYARKELENAETSCLVVKGGPWFQGIEVATLLGYKCPKRALFDHALLSLRIS